LEKEREKVSLAGKKANERMMTRITLWCVNAFALASSVMRENAFALAVMREKANFAAMGGGWFCSSLVLSPF
jgi:hypothetical protein